ncbi:hypothetical protein NB693_22970 [Pantoea ananatis]|uniref:hypothetical protein n=1 Tax=Pantoea ananas TaxID=553 RepID=UPI002220035D|nr:hypothetical protein [Pantoea ananatis]
MSLLDAGEGLAQRPGGTTERGIRQRPRVLRWPTPAAALAHRAWPVGESWAGGPPQPPEVAGSVVAPRYRSA